MSNRVRLSGTHIDPELSLRVGSLRSRCGAEDVVLHDGLTVRTDHGRRHLASGHGRRNPVLAVDGQRRVFPAEIGALLLDFTRYEGAIVRLAGIGGAVCFRVFVTGGHPVEASGTAGIIHLDMTATHVLEEINSWKFDV